MTAVNAVKSCIRRTLRKMGYNVYRLSNEERLQFDTHERRLANRPDPVTSGQGPTRLRDLKTRYARIDLPITRHSLWGAKSESNATADIGWGGVDLQNFREGAYVGSYAGANPLTARLKFFIYADAVRRKDTLQLLGKLEEDGAFGSTIFDYPGLGHVSRDLLDSIVEINFLCKHLNIQEQKEFSVLDVGAGYGRMAHRLLEANPHIKSYTCVDVVPESTFLCEFYLGQRGMLDRAQVVPLYELEEALSSGKYDLALNIHSFSECTFEAISWWLQQLSIRRVRHLMIVPNHPERFLSFETDGTQRDYAPLLQHYGYELIAREPVFDDPAVREILVEDNMFLFELRQTGNAVPV